MPGSGLRASNVIDVAKITGATEFHTSARINIESKMNYKNEAMKENLQTVLVDEEEVKQIIANLKSL
jgi:copper homeostasis protein